MSVFRKRNENRIYIAFICLKEGGGCNVVLFGILKNNDESLKGVKICVKNILFLTDLDHRRTY